MKTIWKYELNRAKKSQSIRMPRYSSILDVQMQQDGVPVVWATVDTDTPMEERQFVLMRTGEEVSGYPTHIGTFQVGMMVYHLFEEFEEIPF